MAWQGILGHDKVVENLRHAVTHNRLASSFLFVGPAGIGKRTFALRFAQALLCERAARQPMEPCGVCQSCVMATAGTHPDIAQVAKPEDKSEIPVETFLGPKERRGREGLSYTIGLKPYLGGRKIALIDDADHLNEEGANCLLKTLEEPPPRSVLILIGTSPSRQLPTIRSRCQLLRFQPLSEAMVAELLVSQGIVQDAIEANRLAQISGGSIERAAEMADPEFWSWRSAFLEKLAERPLRSAALAQTVSTFVDNAGKEAPLRRNRLRQVVVFAAQHYRQALLAASGTSDRRDATVDSIAFQSASDLSPDVFVTRLERCIEALRQIDRNANQTTLIEAWLDDLAAAGESRI